MTASIRKTVTFTLLWAFGGAVSAAPQPLPGYIDGPILHAFYDGISDDLLTGGLGKTGLQSAVAPAYADPLHPTASELRRAAIYNNYRALADMTTNGGYGVLYGPNIDLSGHDTLGEGKIAGDEYLAYADPGNRHRNVTVMVQIPASFDPDNPCIVAAPSSGSRGVYGAIGTTGEWGLKRGCAVAYTDKGTGSGLHDLAANTVNLIDGTRADASAAGNASNFTAPISDAERLAYNALYPNRFAYKHAHSRLNPEKDWGNHVIQSLKFAFSVLNDKFGTHKKRHPINPGNTLVIASSVSNGGGASLAAGELDTDGLIDGIVVSEPQAQPAFNPALVIMRGSKVITNAGKGLYDYITLANLYQPCAALAASNAGAPFGFIVDATRAADRCAALNSNGLLTAATLAEQATEAQAVLNANGWEPESNILGPSHYGLPVAPAVAVTYAFAHGRFSVLENTCGYNFGGTGATGAPTVVPAANIAQIFATGNGVPPTSGINLINNFSVGGPLNDPVSISVSTGKQDYNVDGALCLRQLFTGTDATALRVQAGIDDVKRSGNLHGKPTIIVQGRSDNLLPVNHASRPYYGLNKLVEGAGSDVVYYEVLNANHFEAFIGLLAGYDTRLVPLHVYGIQALDMMYAHLMQGTALAPSQVIRTTPRGGTPGLAPPITAANVPPISNAPAAADRITFTGSTLTVPD